tara:strand:- start:52 stop:729 length:678 start_codon:yes stop_codon:yes gene_type:complete
MLVKDIEPVVKNISEYFTTNYKPSNPVDVTGVEKGWTFSEQSKESGNGVFSDDFLSISLPRVLEKCASDRIVDGEILRYLPDDIHQRTADFILNYDEIHGYNGVLMDLRRAEAQFSYQLGFSIRSNEMDRRRTVTNVPEDGKEAEWYAQINQYTRLDRPRFDHLSQVHEEEYKALFDPSTPYRRGRLGSQKQSQTDRLHKNLSEYTQTYVMHPSHRRVTPNTYTE